MITVGRAELSKDAYIDAYIPDRVFDYAPKEGKPAILIIPGGGYGRVCSEREGEPIALNFLAKGFNCFVLNYRVGFDAVYPNALEDAALAMRHIRNNAEKYAIDKNKIAVMGFSAGGHLAASLSTMYNREELLERGFSENEVRPDATVLGYPVISGIEDTHLGSIQNITADMEPTEEERINVSCECFIDEDTPPAFIWHTSDDTCVPVINSLVYAEGLAACRIPFEMRIYRKGEHGLATGDCLTLEKSRMNKARGVNNWIDDAAEFLFDTFGVYR